MSACLATLQPLTEKAGVYGGHEFLLVTALWMEAVVTVLVPTADSKREATEDHFGDRSTR